jgi:hypothetical protein
VNGSSEAVVAIQAAARVRKILDCVVVVAPRNDDGTAFGII